jgi:hypothetical protein
MLCFTAPGQNGANLAIFGSLKYSRNFGNSAYLPVIPPSQHRFKGPKPEEHIVLVNFSPKGPPRAQLGCT